MKRKIKIIILVTEEVQLMVKFRCLRGAGFRISYSSILFSLP